VVFVFQVRVSRFDVFDAFLYEGKQRMHGGPPIPCLAGESSVLGAVWLGVHSLSVPCAIALFVQSTVVPAAAHGGRDKTVPNSVNAATESFFVGRAQIVSSQKLSCPAPCLLYTTTPFLSGRATTIRRGSGSDIQRPTTSPLSIGRGLWVVFLSVVLNSACDFPNRSFPRRSHV
jgi:hypothetical protein